MYRLYHNIFYCYYDLVSAKADHREDGAGKFAYCINGIDFYFNLGKQDLMNFTDGGSNIQTAIIEILRKYSNNKMSIANIPSYLHNPCG